MTVLVIYSFFVINPTVGYIVFIKTYKTSLLDVHLLYLLLFNFSFSSLQQEMKP